MAQRQRQAEAVVDLGEGCGSKCRVDDDRGIKGIFGEFVACLAQFRLHAGGIAAPLIV